jgi:hypothetical protein
MYRDYIDNDMNRFLVLNFSERGGGGGGGGGGGQKKNLVFFKKKRKLKIF